MDHADRAIAVLHRLDDHAHRCEIVDLVELPTLLCHLRIDRVEVLGASSDLCGDTQRLKLRRQVSTGLGYIALAVLALLGDQLLDLPILAWIKRRESKILELPLDCVDTEPVSYRRVDLKRLARLLKLLLLGHGLN